MRALLILCLTLLSGTAYSQTTTDPPSPSAGTVKGDVLYWEGDELVVKEMSGREVRLRVNGETKIEGAASKLKTGDKIEATLTPQGQTTTIRLQVPDAGGPPLGSPRR